MGKVVPWLFLKGLSQKSRRLRNWSEFGFIAGNYPVSGQKRGFADFSARSGCRNSLFFVYCEEGCRNMKEIRPVILSVIFSLWTDILFGSELMFLHGSGEIFRRQQRFSPKTAVCFRKSLISIQLEYGSCIWIRRPGPTENFRRIYAKHTLFDGEIHLCYCLCSGWKKVISRWYIRYNLQKKTGSQFWLTESWRISDWWGFLQLSGNGLYPQKS